MEALSVSKGEEARAGLEDWRVGVHASSTPAWNCLAMETRGGGGEGRCRHAVVPGNGIGIGRVAVAGSCWIFGGKAARGVGHLIFVAGWTSVKR